MVPGIEKQNYASTEMGARLPQMAAMFFDALAYEKGAERSIELPKINFRPDLRKKIKFVRLPDMQGAAAQKSTSLTREVPAEEIHVELYRREDSFTQLRTFILNLSHSYNNILMGVMGNISLIKMDLKDGSEHQETVVRLEQLIQTGANMINLILGYLVERRVAAKRLQLIQLFGDFDICCRPEDLTIDIESFKENMRQIAAINDRPKIVAAVARLLGQLLAWVKEGSNALAVLNSGSSKLQPRLDIVDHQLEKGFAIVQDLQHYAGTLKPTISRTSLWALMRRHIRRLKASFPRITVWDDIPKSWPSIYIDRHQIDYALRQIFDNAIEAMPGKGSLSIRMRALKDELPSERCAVHSGRDYVVITIADSGKGMDTRTQGRIFLPFYREKKDHIGMGLAAACGIVKSHGGFIQVRSSHGCGTRMKIYLPL